MHIGNPCDGLLRPAIERVTAQFGAAPVLVTADRGYWDSIVEDDLADDLADAGVTSDVFPRTGKASQARAAIEHADAFITAVKWRTGHEGARRDDDLVRPRRWLIGSRSPADLATTTMT